MEKDICCICGKEINGYGNNPSPLKDSGRCCEECNELAIKTRLLLTKYYGSEIGKEEVKSFCKENNANRVANIGAKVVIVEMNKEPNYAGKYGTIIHIDDIGQLHGTWGGCALIPELDVYLVI